jgi:hypothetical protein
MAGVIAVAVGGAGGALALQLGKTSQSAEVVAGSGNVVGTAATPAMAAAANQANAQVDATVAASTVVADGRDDAASGGQASPSAVAPVNGAAPTVTTPTGVPSTPAVAEVAAPARPADGLPVVGVVPSAFAPSAFAPSPIAPSPVAPSPDAPPREAQSSAAPPPAADTDRKGAIREYLNAAAEAEAQARAAEAQMRVDRDYRQAVAEWKAAADRGAELASRVPPASKDEVAAAGRVTMERFDKVKQAIAEVERRAPAVAEAQARLAAARENLQRVAPDVVDALTRPAAASAPPAPATPAPLAVAPAPAAAELADPTGVPAPARDTPAADSGTAPANSPSPANRPAQVNGPASPDVQPFVAEIRTATAASLQPTADERADLLRRREQAVEEREKALAAEKDLMIKGPGADPAEAAQVTRRAEQAKAEVQGVDVQLMSVLYRLGEFTIARAFGDKVPLLPEDGGKVLYASADGSDAGVADELSADAGRVVVPRTRTVYVPLILSTHRPTGWPAAGPRTAGYDYERERAAARFDQQFRCPPPPRPANARPAIDPAGPGKAAQRGPYTADLKSPQIKSPGGDGRRPAVPQATPALGQPPAGRPSAPPVDSGRLREGANGSGRPANPTAPAAPPVGKMLPAIPPPPAAAHVPPVAGQPAASGTTPPVPPTSAAATPPPAARPSAAPQLATPPQVAVPGRSAGDRSPTAQGPGNPPVTDGPGLPNRVPPADRPAPATPPPSPPEARGGRDSGPSKPAQGGVQGGGPSGKGTQPKGSTDMVFPPSGRPSGTPGAAPGAPKANGDKADTVKSTKGDSAGSDSDKDEGKVKARARAPEKAKPKSTDLENAKGSDKPKDAEKPKESDKPKKEKPSRK